MDGEAMFVRTDQDGNIPRGIESVPGVSESGPDYGMEEVPT